MASTKNQVNLERIRLFNYLIPNIATSTMAAKDTGISQKNICRYKRELEKDNRLFVLGKGRCKVTGRKAQYLTTSINVWRAFSKKKL